MARIISRRGRQLQADRLAIGLAVVLAALAGWNLNAWVMPPATIVHAARLADDRGTPDSVSARFDVCGHGVRVTCVVDGDTFWLRGQKIRIADIDTPEISAPRCPAELDRGRLATQRLAGLLNAGPFSLESGARAQDRYGRALLRVTRNGASLGDVLVDEGLAVRFGNGRPDWC